MLDGTVDAMTTDGAILLGYAAQNPDELEVVGEPFSEERIRRRLQPDDPEMCEFLNETIEGSFEDGTWEEAFGPPWARPASRRRSRRRWTPACSLIEPGVPGRPVRSGAPGRRHPDGGGAMESFSTTATWYLQAFGHTAAVLVAGVIALVARDRAGGDAGRPGRRPAPGGGRCTSSLVPQHAAADRC